MTTTDTTEARRRAREILDASRWDDGTLHAGQVEAGITAGLSALTAERDAAVARAEKLGQEATKRESWTGFLTRDISDKERDLSAVRAREKETLRLLDIAHTRFLGLSMVAKTCDIERIRAFAESTLVEIGATGWTLEAMTTGKPSASPESARAFLAQHATPAPVREAPPTVGDWFDATTEGRTQGFINGPYQLTGRVDNGFSCRSTAPAAFDGVILDENFTHGWLRRVDAPATPAEPRGPRVPQAGSEWREEPRPLSSEAAAIATRAGISPDHFTVAREWTFDGSRGPFGWHAHNSLDPSKMAMWDDSAFTDGTLTFVRAATPPAPVAEPLRSKSVDRLLDAIAEMPRECGMAFERIGALDGSGPIQWRHCNLEPGHRPPCDREKREAAPVAEPARVCINCDNGHHEHCVRPRLDCACEQSKECTGRAAPVAEKPAPEVCGLAGCVSPLPHLPCPHTRPTWHMCPHCNGVNAAVPPSETGTRQETQNEPPLAEAPREWPNCALTQGQADAIFVAIAHGDEKHKGWLMARLQTLVAVPTHDHAAPLPGRGEAAERNIRNAVAKWRDIGNRTEAGISWVDAESLLALLDGEREAVRRARADAYRHAAELCREGLRRMDPEDTFVTRTAIVNLADAIERLSIQPTDAKGET